MSDQKTCNKVAYGSKAEATKESHNIRFEQRYYKKVRNKKAKRKLTSYLCNDCGLWHLTSMKKTTIRSMKRRLARYGKTL